LKKIVNLAEIEKKEFDDVMDKDNEDNTVIGNIERHTTWMFDFIFDFFY